MSEISNRSLLAKADLALADLQSDGGLLLPEQSKNFIELMIKEAVLMKMITVTTMKSHKKQIDKIVFDGRVLHSAEACNALPAASRAKPKTSQVELDAKLFKAQINLCDEVLEDNIEGRGLQNKIMSMLTKKIGSDLDTYILESDTASADYDMKQFDGMIKAATTNATDAAGVRLNKTILRDMMKTMPSEYVRDKSKLAYLVSHTSEIDYIDTLADRTTVMGDQYLQNGGNTNFMGVKIVSVPNMPENLIGGDKTAAFLLDPKNVTFGMWRNIKIETDKDIEKGEIKIVASMRFDVKYAHEPAVVKAFNILA